MTIVKCKKDFNLEDLKTEKIVGLSTGKDIYDVDLDIIVEKDGLLYRVQTSVFDVTLLPAYEIENTEDSDYYCYNKDFRDYWQPLYAKHQESLKKELKNYEIHKRIFR